MVLSGQTDTAILNIGQEYYLYVTD